MLWGDRFGLDSGVVRAVSCVKTGFWTTCRFVHILPSKDGSCLVLNNYNDQVVSQGLSHLQGHVLRDAQIRAVKASSNQSIFKQTHRQRPIKCIEMDWFRQIAVLISVN